MPGTGTGSSRYLRDGAARRIDKLRLYAVDVAPAANGRMAAAPAACRNLPF
jgi:hypothetical protein